MAWPNKIYVATTALGVFYTEDFVDPSTQPTWTAVNTGLAATTCAEFWLDPFTPATRQYVMAGSPRVLYRRDNEGDWASILTVEQARILTGYAWTDDNFGGFCCDPANAGVLWAVYRNSDGAWQRPLCILRSDDWGDTWSLVAVPFNDVYLYQYDSVRANGDNVFVAAAIGAGGTAVTYCSDDAGSTWQYVAQEYNTTWPICHNPLLPTSAYTTTHTNSPLRRVTSSGVGTTLQDDIGPGRWDAMWFHPSDADHQRVLRDAKLHVTYDGWDTYDSGDTISPEVVSFAPWAGSDVNHMIVGLTLGHVLGQNHVIGVLYDEDDVTATGIAGASPGSDPYTDSIPYTCGGLAKMGIWAVEEEPSEGPTPPPGSTITPPDKPGESPSTPITLGGDVLTQAVTMPDYTGDDRGEPLPGDRGAWDVVDYAARHARDLKDAAPVHHVPEGDAAGDAPVWDGDKWVSTAVATQAELDTHEGEANPHGTELGDLTDVDLATDPPEDGEGLVWDEVASAWVPADVTTLADHDHSGDAGDGGTFDAANLTSGVATDGQVLTADGAGNTAWEDPSGGEGGGHEILDDGTPMPQRAALDFVGFDLADDDYGDATLVSLPEGAYAETVGDSVEVTYDVEHSLNTTDVVVQVWDLDATPITLVSPSVYVVDADTVRVTFGSAPDTDQMRVVVVKGGGGGGEGAGLANPMTTAGDIIVGGAAGAASRLGIGTAGQVLKVNAGATAPEWGDESGGGGGGIASHEDSYASPPASPNEGDLWVPNDGVYLLRRGASAWAPWGPIFPMVEPDLGDFTWVNQGAATADDAYGGIYLSGPATGGDNLRLLVKDAPDTPYTITAAIIPCGLAVNYMRLGMAFRQSSDGKIHTCEVSHANGLCYASLKWNHATSYSGNYMEVRDRPISPVWLRIGDDGTNRTFERSVDGHHWQLLHSIGRTDFLTADQVGLFVNAGQGTWDVGMLVVSWEEA